MKIHCPSCKRNTVAEQVGDTLICRGHRSNGFLVEGAVRVKFECGKCGHVWEIVMPESEAKEAAK